MHRVEFLGSSLSPYFAMIGKPEILCDAVMLRERERDALHCTACAALALCVSNLTVSCALEPVVQHCTWLLV